MKHSWLDASPGDAIAEVVSVKKQKAWIPKKTTIGEHKNNWIWFKNYYTISTFITVHTDSHGSTEVWRDIETVAEEDYFIMKLQGTITEVGDVSYYKIDPSDL